MTAESTTGVRPVVVGADGSGSALQAVRWAAVEADRRGTALRVVTAFGWTPEHGHRGRSERYRAELLERTRRHVLAGAVTLAERAVTGLAVTAELVVGSPLATLVDRSRDAQLLVLGSRGLGGLTGLLIGSVAVGAAAHAACPVVVVRGDDRDPQSPEPVVVGMDRSSNSDAALAFAFDAAAARGAPLVAVRTWGEHVYDPQIAALIDWRALAAEERDGLAEWLGPWTAKFPDVPVSQVVVRESAAPVLVERSRTAQMVVVGSRGRGNLTGLLLGSVSHALLHRGHCPVAVVRTGDAEGDR